MTWDRRTFLKTLSATAGYFVATPMFGLEQQYTAKTEGMRMALLSVDGEVLGSKVMRYTVKKHKDQAFILAETPKLVFPPNELGEIGKTIAAVEYHLEWWPGEPYPIRTNVMPTTINGGTVTLTYEYPVIQLHDGKVR